MLGRTLDDAAGEAFDKGARLLGLPYPGGPALERLAAEGDPGAFAFPTAAGVAGLDFSFAGLKTALLYKIRDLGEDEARARRADLAAAYQHAIVEALALRVERGLASTGLRRLAVGGGVAANGPLRRRMAALGVPLQVPARELCTDNAAMIASAARWVTPAADPGCLASTPTPRASAACEHRDALRAAWLPPVRRRARGARAPARREPVHPRGGRHRVRRRRSCGPTSSASRWSRSTVEQLYDFHVDEADLRSRLARVDGR